MCQSTTPARTTTIKGPHTSGRTYRNLFAVAYRIPEELGRPVLFRDGTRLMADVYRPDADDVFLALIPFFPIHASPNGYPRAFLHGEGPRCCA
jgi:hypothetical protein